MVNGEALETRQCASVSLRLVRDHGDALDALAPQLQDHSLHREDAVQGLAAGHSHRVVVEDLVGDVDPGGDGGPDGQQPGMKISAIAHVLKDMARVGERRLSDPGGAFPAHLGEGVGVPVHPQRHVVATYAGQGHAVFRHLGGGVVGTTGAIIGRAGNDIARLGQAAFFGLQEIQPFLHGLAGVEAPQARGDGAGHHGRRQLRQVRQQVPALFVELAQDPGPFGDGPVVELPGELILHDAALFLHHQDLLQPLGELVGGEGFQRPAHAQLIDPQADAGGLVIVYAQVVQGLQDIQVALARGDDPQTRLGAVELDLVQAVHIGEMARGVDLVFVEALFLLQGVVRPAGMHAVFRQFKVVGDDDVHPARVQLGGNGGVQVFRDGLQGRPATAVARQLPA